MKAEKIIAIILAMWGLVLCPSLAKATLITIEIEGVVDSVWDAGNYLEGKIKVGDTITGSYTYDSSTPDQDWIWGSPSPTVGRYHYFSSPYGITLTADGVVFQTDPTSVNFLVGIVNDNDSGADIYWLDSYNNLPLANGIIVNGISWQLNDPTGSIFSSDALPATAPVLVNWEWNSFHIDSLRIFGISGHITSATLIPEPGTFLFIGFGALILRRKTLTKK